MPKLKTKIRVYVAMILVLASLSITSYLNAIKECDMTELDEYYANNAELIIERLRQTKWGKSFRGRKILTAFRHDELRILIPTRVVVRDKKYYIFKDLQVEGPASGLMQKHRGMYRIYIGLYHISDIDRNKKSRLIRYTDYAIPEDEFIHILIDELLSRSLRGFFFVDGTASVQEELDAWNAAEEAVKAYYDDKNYSVDGLSQSPPIYGPDNPFYIKME